MQRDRPNSAALASAGMKSYRSEVRVHWRDSRAIFWMVRLRAETSHLRFESSFVQVLRAAAAALTLLSS
jgi:hypothetical protein